MFGAVGGAVVLFVCYEGRETAEPDVAQPAVAAVSVLQWRDQGRFWGQVSMTVWVGFLWQLRV